MLGITKIWERWHPNPFTPEPSSPLPSLPCSVLHISTFLTNSAPEGTWAQCNHWVMLCSPSGQLAMRDTGLLFYRRWTKRPKQVNWLPHNWPKQRGAWQCQWKSSKRKTTKNNTQACLCHGWPSSQPGTETERLYEKMPFFPCSNWIQLWTEVVH